MPTDLPNLQRMHFLKQLKNPALAPSGYSAHRRCTISCPPLDLAVATFNCAHRQQQLSAHSYNAAIRSNLPWQISQRASAKAISVAPDISPPTSMCATTAQQSSTCPSSFPPSQMPTRRHKHWLIWPPRKQRRRPKRAMRKRSHPCKRHTAKVQPVAVWQQVEPRRSKS